MANKKITYDIGFKTDLSGLQQVKAELQNINAMSLKELKLINPNATKADLEEIKSAAEKVGKAIEASFNPKLNTVSIDRFNQSIKESGLNVSQISQKFSQIGTNGTIAFRNLASELLTTKNELKQTNSLLDSMATTLGNTIKWSIASGAINMVTGSIQKAWGFTKNLDESLNNIRIVTGKSAQEMDKFAKKANNAAKSLGTATTQYSDAALIYYQQGLGEEDVNARTNVTIKAANVTGQSAAEVSEQLTAVWNGYKVVAEEAELYVDKLAAVAATTAADLEELSDGMSKVASAANTMGVDVDQLSAQLATIVSVTRQDAAVVGTALKTIFARMGDLKVDGVDEFGTSLGDVSGQMRQMGIEVLDQEGNLRDMGSVIEEVAKKWGTWTDAQQQAAAVAIAGKRQYNNLIALFENWDMYESALATSKGSEGTLQKQQETFMDSLEYRLKRVAAAGEQIYASLFDTESTKKLLDAFVWIEERIANLINGMGGAGNLLLSLGGTLTKVFGGQLSQELFRIGNNIGLIGQKAREAKAAELLRSQFDISSDAVLQEVLEIKEKELRYSNLLTQEEKEQLNLYIKQKLELANQLGLEKERQKKAVEYAEKATGQTIDPAAQRSSDKRITVDKAVNQLRSDASGLEDIISDQKKKNIGSLAVGTESKDRLSIAEAELSQEVINFGINDLIKERDKIIAQLFKQAQQDLGQAGETLEIDGIKYDQKKFAKDLNASKSKINFEDEKGSSQLQVQNLNDLIIRRKELLKQAKEILNTAKQLKESDKLDQQSKSKLTTAYIEQSTAINQALKGTGDFAKGIEAARILEDAYQKELAETKQRINETADALEQTGPKMDSLKEKKEELDKNNKPLFDGLATKATIQNITNTISGIMSITSSVNMLSQAWKVWGDETLSTEEKVEQTIQSVLSSLGSMLPAVLSSIEMITTANIAGATASQAAWGWIGLVLMAVTLISSLVINIIGSIPKAQTPLEKSQQALDNVKKSAEEAKEKVADLKDEYANLLDEMDKFQEARLAIDDMREGTEEWQDAVQELNFSVLDLINKYPKLIEFLTQTNGVYGIKQEGWDQLAQEQEKAILNQSRISAALGVETQYRENNVLDASTREKIIQTALANSIAGEATDTGISLKYSSRTRGYSNTNENVDQITKFFKEQFGIEAIDREENGELAGGTVTYKDFAIGATSLNTVGWSPEKLESLNKAIDALNNDELENAIKELINSSNANSDKLEINSKEINANSKVILDSIAKEEGVNQQVYSDIASDIIDQSVFNLDTYKQQNALARWISGESNDVPNEFIGDSINSSDDRNATHSEIMGMIKEVYGEGASASLTADMLQGQSRDTIGEVTFTVNGKETTVGQLINDLAQQRMDAAIKEATDALREDQKNISGKGYMAQAAYFMSGRKGESWKDATLGALNTLGGYGDLDPEYLKAVNDYKTNFIKSINKVLQSSALTSSYSATAKQFEGFTEEDTKTFVKNFEKAGLYGGTAAIESLFSQIADSPELTKTVNSLLSNVDWSDSGSINNFRAGLIDLGIDIETDNEIWDKFIDSVANGTKQWIKDQKTVTENLKTIRDLAKDMSTGDILSLPDFRELAKIAPEIANSFIKTADGMMYIGQSGQLAKDLKKQYQDLGSISTAYSKINTAAEKVAGDSYFTQDAFKTSGLGSVKNYFNENRLALATALGIDTGSITSQLNVLSTADTDSPAYAAALDWITGVAGQINQAALDAANGLFSSEAAEELWVSEVAESWTDVQEKVGILSTSVYEDAAKLWKNRFIEELGYGADWGAELSADAVYDHLQKVRKLELDYYQDINAEIEKLGTKIERAFGNEKLALLNESVTQQINKEAIANAQLALADETFTEALNNSIYKNLFEEKGLIGLFNRQTEVGMDSSEGQAIQSLIEKYTQLQEKSQEAAEANWAVVDAQVAGLNAILEYSQKLKDFSQDWLSFQQVFSRYMSEGVGMEAFLKENALTAFNNAKARYGIEDAFMTALESSLGYGIDANNFTYNGNYGKNAQIEYLSGVIEQGRSSLEAMQKELDTMYDSWMNSQEELMELFDRQINKLSNINSILGGSADLWKIVGKGSEKYLEILNTYYNTIKSNSKDSYDLAVAQLNTLQDQYDFALENGANEEQIRELEENLITATELVADAANEMFTAITDEFSNALSGSIDKFIQNATGLDLAGISEDWRLANAGEESYLDEVNKAYAINQLERDVQGSIDKTDNLSAQKKINSVMQEQIKILREKDKLSQYEVDRANALYDLTLKQIALEEAQQTANKMKLTRDAMGNYTYQYVQDEDAIAKAEEELAAAENRLYNLDKDRNKALVDNYYTTMTEANTLITEAMAAGDKERAARLHEYYFGEDGVLRGIQKELGMAEENLAEMGHSLAGEGWTSKLTEFTNEIVKMNLGELATNIGGLITQTGEELDLTKETVKELLGSDGLLTTTVGALTTSVEKSVDLADGVKEITTQTNLILTSMPDLITNVGALATNLNNYAQKLSDLMTGTKENDPFKDNTNAVNSATSAIENLKNTLESGITGKVDITDSTINFSFDQVGEETE